jgi:hypothetical protein
LGLYAGREPSHPTSCRRGIYFRLFLDRPVKGLPPAVDNLDPDRPPLSATSNESEANSPAAGPGFVQSVTNGACPLQVALDRDGAPEVRRMVGAEWPAACQRSATRALCHIRLFHIAYDGLPAFIDVDALDTDALLPAVS